MNFKSKPPSRKKHHTGIKIPYRSLVVASRVSISVWDPSWILNLDLAMTYFQGFGTISSQNAIQVRYLLQKDFENWCCIADAYMYYHLANHTRNSRCSHKMARSSMIGNAWRRYISDDSSSSPWPCRSDECDAESIGVAHGEHIPPIAVCSTILGKTLWFYSVIFGMRKSKTLGF